MLRNTLQRYPLFVIVLAQLCGTSLWFSINGVWISLSRELGLSESDVGSLTLSVQAGFIIGTLGIAVTGLAHRYRASYIFVCSSLFGALMNAGFVLTAASPPFDLAMRFLTGLCFSRHLPSGHEAGHWLDAQTYRGRTGLVGRHAHPWHRYASLAARSNTGAALAVAVTGFFGAGSFGWPDDSAFGGWPSPATDRCKNPVA